MSNRCEQRTNALILKKASIRWSSAILLVLFVSPVFGQTAPQPQSSPATMDQAPGISTNVDEVSLDLAVHDKNQNPVLDMKPEDFTVTDNGAPVKLTSFRFVSGEAAASRGHMITLVFDAFHGATAKNARIIAEKVLKALPNDGYSFAAMDFAGRLRLIQGFTDDRQAVEQAVNVITESNPMIMASTHSLAVNIMDDKAAEESRIKAASQAEKNLIAIAQTGVDLSGHHVDVKDRARAQALFTALQDAQTITQEKHPQLNFAGLLALVKSQQTLGDRKAVIYFTRNQQLDKAAKEMLKTIAAAATRAGVSVYTVDLDAAGNSSQYQLDNEHLNGQRPYDPHAVPTDGGYGSKIPMQQAAGTPIQGDPSPTGPVWGPAQDLAMATDFARGNNEDRTNPFNDTKSPMADFSKSTGGAYIDALNSVKGPLQQMAQDLSAYYQASYVPPFKEYDGTYRTIAVKTLRAGLHIQTKSGYFALPPGADAGIQPFEAPLLKTLAQPQLPSSIKFHAAVLRFGDLPDGNTSSLAVEVPLSELQAKEDPHSGPSTAHLSIVAQIKDKGGEVVEHYGEEITKRGAKETLDHDPSAILSLERHFISAPGKYTMEVAVLDQNSGKTAAKRIVFEILDKPGDISLSDMVLVLNMEGSQEEADDPLEPLRYEHQKVRPNLTGELPADAKDLSLFFFLHPDPASNEPMALEMELIHNGKPGKRTPLLHSDGVHAAVPYLASVKSHALPPGDYEIRAYLIQGGKTAEQSETFRVVGATGAQPASADLKWVEGADFGSDSGDRTMDSPPQAVNQLAITAPASPAPAPPQDEARLLIEEARERALSYNDSLPNFVCTEVTKRSVDVNGAGRWKLRDTIVELLSYREKVETRTTLEVNGSASNTDRDALKGTFSAGEFGGVLQAIFRSSSKAEFQWKETDSLNGGAVQVYDYRVDRGNSMFSVIGSNGKRLIAGFHGQVFIDSSTRRARRITLVADDLPPDFPTHTTSIGVDYDFVPINGLKYLVPVSAELQTKQGKQEAVINTMEFKDYKRLAAE
jgi:VWFA-related protein